MDSLSELELCNFLGDDLFLFVSDGETPTTNFAYGSPSHLESTGKELDELFNNAFEEFDGYNKGIEVNSRKNDNDTTMATKRHTKATRNFVLIES